MVKLTAVIAFFTILAAIGSLGAMLFIGGQLKEMRASGKQIDRQIAVAERTAETAKVQASAAQGQVQALGRQVDVARSSLAIEAGLLGVSRRAEGLAEQRAREETDRTQLARSNVKVDVSSMSMSFVAGGYLDLAWVIENKTGAEIVIRKIGAALEPVPLGEVNDPSRIRAFVETMPEGPALRIAEGASKVGNIPHRDKTSQELAEALNSGRLYLRGYVALLYEDATHKLHHAYACRAALRDAQTFFATDCPVPKE